MNKIKAALKNHYDLDIINVLPQKGGWAALAYKVCTGNHTYFLKVYEKSRSSTPKWTALINKYAPIMNWLAENSGLNGKIPVPLKTTDGVYKCEDDDGIYMLYEYMEGETIGEKSLTGEQVHQLSEIIAELHLYGEEIPVETDALKEDFEVPFLRQIRGVLDQEYYNLPNDVKEAVTPHIEPVKGLVNTVEKLSSCLKAGNLEMALCHTDIHNWNLMYSGQQLIVIDWEGLRLAPVEADLMFLVDKPYFEEFLNVYKKVHTRFEINCDALCFYQGRRKLEDIWEFLEQLLFDKQDAEVRADTIKCLTNELKDLSK